MFEMLTPSVTLNCRVGPITLDRKSTRLNSSHGYISYAVFCLKKKTGFPIGPTGRLDFRIDPLGARGRAPSRLKRCALQFRRCVMVQRLEDQKPIRTPGGRPT